MKSWNFNIEADTIWARRVLREYGYISDASEALSNSQIIDILSPMVDALRRSIQASVEIYMRIPVWGEWRDEDFDTLIYRLTHGLEVYWSSDAWINHISVWLNCFDEIGRMGTIHSRLKNIAWVIGESHRWNSRLLDGSDFNLTRRIHKYQLLAYFLNFFESC